MDFVDKGQHLRNCCLSGIQSLKNLKKGQGCDVIYTDFSKAFDKVETGVLLHKVRDCEITGKVGVWLASFLDSATRQQAVAVDGIVSNLMPVLSGVPQGTVLGPVLFLIHIMDIAANLSAGTTATSFADDTRVQRGISCSQDCSDLQKDLESIYKWAETVNMHFNSDKFECLRFWPHSNDPPTHEYKGPDENVITVKDSLKDLGVEVSSTLDFKTHVSKVVASASKLTGWALRSFRRRNKLTMRSIWHCLVQPKMDYCSQLWSPCDQQSINKIESVQRHFVEKIKGLEEMCYWEKLKVLKMYSQERRRERYIIIFLWKLSQNMVRGYNVTFCENPRRGRLVVPSHPPQSASARVKQARESSLQVKGAKLFNLLPTYLRNIDAENVDTFKKELDWYLSPVPDEPTSAGLLQVAETNSLLHQIPLMTAI